MPLISGTIPNLVNGISQQAPTLRLRTQGEVQQNAYPSLVEGLKKRPPLEHVAKLQAASASGAFVHTINRDSTERYKVIITNGDLKVYDLSGNEKTVTFPDGKSYLTASSPQSDFAAITVADYTFIVNKTVTAAMSGTTDADRDAEALVHVKLGQPDTTYEVYIDGVKEADYTTTSTASTYETTNIATELYNDLNAGLGANFTVTLDGNVVHITNSASDFDFSTVDSYGDRALIGIKDTVQDFTNLPTHAPDGFVTKVVGDDLNNFDDYYVKFDSTNASGVWVETVDPGLDNDFDPSTMPYSLVRETSGDFTFEEIAWSSRAVGDTDINPQPSFIGREINDVLFFRNRLGFLADENLIMSEIGEYFNFWRTTVTTLLDSDRIDISSSHNEVSILEWGVPYSEELICFAEQAQFILDVPDLLTPSTAALKQTTEFQVNTLAKPVGSGKNVYFSTNQGSFSKVREYFIQGDVRLKDAANVTSHVPKYIPSNIFKITSHDSEDVLFFLSQDETNAVYVYNFLWGGDDGNEKIQSAWGKWLFDSGDEILGMEQIDEYLYFVIERSDGVYLDRMNLQPGLEDTGMGFLNHLDRKTELTGSYNSSTDKTTWTLPYDDGADDYVVVLGSGFGNRLGDTPSVSRPTSTTIEADGDYSADTAYVGKKYNFRYDFSEQVVRQNRGGAEVAVTSGRLTMKTMQVVYNETGYFTVSVTPQYRTDSYEYPFTGVITGQALIGSINIVNGTFRFSVGAKARDVTISLQNDTHLPCKFLSAEWEAQWFKRARAI